MGLWAYGGLAYKFIWAHRLLGSKAYRLIGLFQIFSITASMSQEQHIHIHVPPNTATLHIHIHVPPNTATASTAEPITEEEEPATASSTDLVPIQSAAKVVPSKAPPIQAVLVKSPPEHLRAPKAPPPVLVRSPPLTQDSDGV